ncbi:MAG: UDP-N-acetylglucosamine 2-epimerase [Patescibacteria group bacterium]
MTNKRKILFITERRADYSRLKPIMKAVRQSEKLRLQLLVTGMHLLKSFGETINVIKNDGFKIDAILPTFSENDEDTGASMVAAMGKALTGMSEIFNKLKPDIIFSGFDIGANFAAAITGMHMNIRVCHIQGGEVSGTIDEVIRHGITKFAHIHFPATAKSAERIIKLGENPAYVFNVGSPSLDTIKTMKYLPKQNIFSEYNLDSNKKLIIFLQHPVTTEVDRTVSQIKQSIKAIQTINKKHVTQAIAIYSNNDAGGKRIIGQLKRSGIKILPHIVYEDFLNLMKWGGVLVGNSSSGIHEAPSFGLPVVNIGTRQQFREKGKNVIDVNHDIKEITAAIEKSLFDAKFIKTAKLARNPYDNGETAKKVVKILETIELPPIQKVITY